jgi:hypothetical protein
MSLRPSIEGRSGTLACVLVLVAMCGCTSSSEPPQQRSAAASESGTILAVGDVGPSSPVVAFTLPAQTLSVVPASGNIPVATYTVSHASAPDPAGGTDVVALNGKRTAVVSRIANGGATAVGPALELSSTKSFYSLAVAGGTALAADCSRIATLSITHPTGWTTIGRGCWAGLSPSGTSIVYSTDGSSIERLDGAKGRPVELADAKLLASAFPPGSPRPSFVGPPAWGSGGIAFAMRSGDLVVVALLDPAGQLRTIVREILVNHAQLPRFAWQPHGDTLAFTDSMGSSGGVVRIFHPDSGDLQAFGLDLLGFSQPAWSPDGRSLAVLTSAHALLVVDVLGDWKLHVETRWSDLIGWGQ